MDFTVCRPYKRQRLSNPPEIELHQRREQNDLRLKSTFETIFEKYGKNFDGIGDEIDLETGEIIVNNGHISGMVSERDAGDLGSASEEEESDDEWPDDEKVLASSLLSETRRRIDAFRGQGSMHEEERQDQRELESSDEVDSLLGSNDSLMGDLETQPPSSKMRARSQSPDSLYEDKEMKDELSGKRMEWPTPRRLRPTPNKATPLGHTPWHSSPSKRVYNSENLIDPAWKAPSLPVDSEPRQRRGPAGLISSQKAENSCGDNALQRHHPTQAFEPRTPKRQHIMRRSSTGRMKSSSRQRVGHDAESAAKSRNYTSLKTPRWTQAEDVLLRQLRTTTTLMYGDMTPYFPGRKSQAIMVHWSEITSNNGDRDQSTDPPRSSPALSSRHRLSPNKRLDKPSTDMKWGDRCSNGHIIPTKRVLNSSMKSRASESPHAVPRRALAHRRFKQERSAPRPSLEIPNTSDPTEHSQGITSSPPVPSAHPQTLPTSARSQNSPYNRVKEEEGEEYEAQAVLHTLPLPGVEEVILANAKLRDNANKAPWLSQQFSHKASASRSTKSPRRVNHVGRNTVSATPLSGRTSISRCDPANPFKGSFSRSLYQSDGSDDELSAPIKTVGSY